MGHIGSYQWNEGMPQYAYTGEYPATARDRTGQDAQLPADPCFILGNYRITAFAHVSGQLELITGERGWARLNHLEGNRYWNRASLALGGKVYQLAGDAPYRGPLQEKVFGVGYARYREKLPGNVLISRTISVKPSEKVNDGIPAVLITIRFENTGTEPVECTYHEEFLANYCMLSAQEELTSPEPAARYARKLTTDTTRHLAMAQFAFEPQKLLMPACTAAERHPYDCFPPLLFLRGFGNTEVSVRDKDGMLCCAARLMLEPGGNDTVQIAAGLSFTGQVGVSEHLQGLLDGTSSDGIYSETWRKSLPDFCAEQDETLRWEMLWNAYVLSAMANYHCYFGETTVPQGSVYAYRLGQNTSVRDHLQHSLALAYINPALARSSLRFVLKHECFDGRILRQDIGFGYEDPSIYVESDPQLYLFLAVGEYLRITGNYSFLQEAVGMYPLEEGRQTTVLNALARAFAWLRDVVGRGRHGLMMMRNSDWSDSFFHTYSPNLYAQVAESHLNTAMALVVLPRLAAELKKALPNLETDRDLARRLIDEITAFRAALYEAFMKDMEGRIYAPRCYIGFDDDPKLRFGEDRLCLEAQPWILQMEDFPEERKRRLYTAIQETVLEPEKLGARTREKPLWSGEGIGEDGGMWFAHQGPLMTGIASFSKEEAHKLLDRLTFHHFAGAYPDYWMGHWTAADSVETSLSRREGLYHAWTDHPFQPFCAHAHAWMLYCYCHIFRNGGDME